MIKFRTMVTNAEELLVDLEKQQRDAGNEVLFKMKNDPRVTPIGASCASSASTSCPSSST